MERIRTALEKARGERASYGIGFGGSKHAVASQPKAVGGVDQIKYTQTKSIDVSRSLLRERRIVSGFEPGVYTDAFKILCTQVLQKMRDSGWNALAITSPGENEGKTMTAINLAISMATEVNQTVLLVDANLRHPSVHQYFGLNEDVGLSDYLTGDIPLEKILIHPGIDHFVLLPGGKPLLHSSEMLGSPKMAELVQELKQRYPSRIVLFDLPPLLSAADALAFAPYVDAALLVVEEAKTKDEDIVRAASLLGATNLIGTVLNKSMDPEFTARKSSSWFGLFKRKGH